MQELLQPFAHLVASPAHHGSFIYGQRPIGDDQLLVDADNPSETLACGACPDGGVEREHLVGRLLEGDAVGLELGAEREELRTSVR